MYVSLNNVIVSGRVRWPEFARLAHRAGFGGVDVDLEGAMREGLDSTRGLLKELRLKPAVLPFPVDFRKDDQVFQSGLANLEKAARFGQALGCPRMVTWVLSSTSTPKAELREILKKRFQAAAAILAPFQVRLGLEFLGPLHLRRSAPHEFIWKMGEMLDFARECGPNVGLLLDSWHWHHAGAKPRDILEAGKERIVHVHLADAPDLPPERIRDNERLLPGEGVADLPGFLAALKHIGYSDGLSPEVFGRGLDKVPPEEAAKMALNATRGLLRKAGLM